MPQCLRVDFGDQILDISLFANATIDKWFRFYQQRVMHGYRYQAIRRRPYPRTAAVDLKSLQEIDLNWQTILGCIEQLRRFGMRVPLQISTEFDGKQSTLNLIHRFFTYNSIWHEQWSQTRQPNPWDPDFQLPDRFQDYQQWHDFIDQINLAVHSLEPYCVPTANKVWADTEYPMSSFEFIAKDNVRGDISNNWLAFDEQDQTLNYTYLDDDRPLALLNISICGKPVIQSFIEHDDPTAADCTGRLGSYGGFIVDIDQNRRELYRSHRFGQWLYDHQLDLHKLPLEFPIGWVDDINLWQQVWKSPRSTFFNVSFVEV